MKTKIFLVLVTSLFASVSFAQSAEVSSSSTSNSGATGVGVAGDIAPTQIWAPTSNVEAPERTLFLPNPGGIANPGQLFVNPGQSINSQVAALQLRFMQRCGEKIPTSILDNPRYDRVVDKSKDAIDVVFQPHAQYVTQAPSFASRMKIQNILINRDLSRNKKYTCVGSLFLVTHNDEETATLTDLPAVLNRAKRFVAKNLSGFSDITMLTVESGFGFEREVKGEGRGVSVSPQGSGVIGSVLAAMAGVLSTAESKSGGYERVGAAVLLFAEAPLHSNVAYSPAHFEDSEHQ